jgi:hypothetical protein
MNVLMSINNYKVVTHTVGVFDNNVLLVGLDLDPIDVLRRYY